MPAIANFAVAALDCPDPIALARFYSDLTGWNIAADSDASWAELDSPTVLPRVPRTRRPSVLPLQGVIDRVS